MLRCRCRGLTVDVPVATALQTGIRHSFLTTNLLAGSGTGAAVGVEAVDGGSMSGLDDLMAESDDRWARATRSARGVRDKGLERALKDYYTIYFPIGLVVLLALVAWGEVVLTGGTYRDGLNFLTLGWLLAGVCSLVGSFGYIAKRIDTAVENDKIDVLTSLERQEKKHLRRQITGKAGIEPEHLVVKRAAAVQLRRRLATQLIYSPTVPLFLVAQVSGGNIVFWWLMAAALVTAVAGQAYAIRDFRRAGKFLELTAEDAKP